VSEQVVEQSNKSLGKSCKLCNSPHHGTTEQVYVISNVYGVLTKTTATCTQCVCNDCS
jgi:hypothetical protein